MRELMGWRIDSLDGYGWNSVVKLTSHERELSGGFNLRERANCHRCGLAAPGANCACGMYAVRHLRHLADFLSILVRLRQENPVPVALSISRVRLVDAIPANYGLQKQLKSTPGSMPDPPTTWRAKHLVRVGPCYVDRLTDRQCRGLSRYVGIEFRPVHGDFVDLVRSEQLIERGGQI